MRKLKVLFLKKLGKFYLKLGFAEGDRINAYPQISSTILNCAIFYPINDEI